MEYLLLSFNIVKRDALFPQHAHSLQDSRVHSV
jgi:hypothetical protein